MLIWFILCVCLLGNEWSQRVLSLITSWLHLLLLSSCTCTHTCTPMGWEWREKGLLLLACPPPFTQSALSRDTSLPWMDSIWGETVWMEAGSHFLWSVSSFLAEKLQWLVIMNFRQTWGARGGNRSCIRWSREDSWGVPFAGCFQRWRTSEKLKLPTFCPLHPPGPRWVQTFVTWTPCCPRSRRAPAPAARPCPSARPLSGLLSWTSTLLPPRTPPWPHHTPLSSRNPAGGPPATLTTLIRTPTAASAPSPCTSQDSSQAPELAGTERHSGRRLLHLQLRASRHLWRHHTTISPPAGCSATHHIWPTAWTLSRQLATRQVCCRRGGGPPLWNWWNTSMSSHFLPV